MTAAPLLLAVLLVRAAAPQGPPREAGEFRKAELVELTAIDPTLRLDIRYATANNFLGRPVYRQARAFLQRPAARALARASRDLRRHGYGLLVFDAYRPWSVTKVFWDETPPEKRAFVADPAQGSKHNRGCAVDLTLYDLATGLEVPMPSGYDDMSERASPDFQGGTADERAHRDLLRRVMESHGFTVEPNEWWHFNFKDWRRYPILDVPFPARLPERRDSLPTRGRGFKGARRSAPLLNDDNIASLKAEG
jgi:D-alanyl-D-alanine dipeptidase